MPNTTLPTPLAQPLFDHITIVGAGLIGSSIVRAVKQQNAAKHITVVDGSQQVIDRVAALKIADTQTTDIASGVRDADLVILCVPVGAMGTVAEAMAAHLKSGAIVSDVGSTKASVIRQVAPHLPKGVHFIPAHPVAGTEYSGPDAGFSTLFNNRWSILTPTDGTDQALVEKMRTLWESFGSNVEIMEPQHHDLVLAITSHVPHLIAYNIVGTAADLEKVTQSEVIKFSAGGFRDFTRIAASDPTMWRDVFLNNREAVLEMLGRFNEDIAVLTRAIRNGDGDALFELFSKTRTIRRNIITHGQETDEPNFGRRQ
ncbi:prephenate/arogenate dehydrogenase family protein [Microvirga sp. W0021]|uniref:Prephenate/arogenate dehydrogenase family protein n=1 Tax=Hohaiivirga grylli TaxID=3133970 RepID=A0ABV0BKX6_9HYPH